MKAFLQKWVLDALKPEVLKNPSLLAPSSFTDTEWRHALDYSDLIHARIPFQYVLKRSPFFESLPTWLRATVDTEEIRMRMALALFDEELQSVCTILLAKAIPCLAVKGIEIGTRFYPSRLLRAMSDIDLLVPTKHYETAIQMLRRRGYQLVGNHYRGRFRAELSRGPGTPIVELHAYLSETDDASTVQGIWDRSETILLPGVSTPVHVMSLEDNLSYLIRHASSQHLIESPMWLNDVAFALEAARKANHPLRWEQIIADLSKRKNRVASIFFLRLLQNFCASELPRGWENLFYIRSPFQKLRLFFTRVPYEKIFRRRGWLFVLRFRALLKDSLPQTLIYLIRRQVRLLTTS